MYHGANYESTTTYLSQLKAIQSVQPNATITSYEPTHLHGHQSFSAVSKPTKFRQQFPNIQTIISYYKPMYLVLSV